MYVEGMKETANAERLSRVTDCVRAQGFKLYDRQRRRSWMLRVLRSLGVAATIVAIALAAVFLQGNQDAELIPGQPGIAIPLAEPHVISNPPAHPESGLQIILTLVNEYSTQTLGITKAEEDRIFYGDLSDGNWRIVATLSAGKASEWNVEIGGLVVTDGRAEILPA